MMRCLLLGFAVVCFSLALVGFTTSPPRQRADESVYPDLPRLVLPLSEDLIVQGMTFNGAGRPVLFVSADGGRYYGIQYASEDGKTYAPKFVYVIEKHQ
jgi:hypothetical protein